MRKLLFAAVVIIGVIIYVNYRDTPITPTPSPAASGTAPATNLVPATRPSTRSGGWGEGHQAGYDWAERNAISDESDCEEAGNHSNSPSFAEGCTAYVNGESAP